MTNNNFSSSTKSYYSGLSCLRQIVGLLWVDLLSILVESDPWRWCTIAATFSRTNTRYHSVSPRSLSMWWDQCTERSCREWHTRRSIGASDTFLGRRIRERRRRQRYHLCSSFTNQFSRLHWNICWNSVDFRMHAGERARRTNSGTLNHIADGESFYCLVLWCTPRAIGAANRLHMPSTFLFATALVDISYSNEYTWERYG